ncbi:hypothetical protein [Nocardia fluminea]|uniref:hypothetical protein n=1 Tax=Nocardia fluminea TaxID=134984 RepID=UPI003D114DC0
MTKKKESAVVDDALAAYRKALIDDAVEERVAELAVLVGEWQNKREERRETIERLQAEEEATEDAVVAAYEAAREAGAKVTTLERIKLKPTDAITSVARRAAREKGRNANAAVPTPKTTPERVEAAKVPLTQPEEKNPHSELLDSMVAQHGTADNPTKAGPVPVAQSA